LKKKKKRKRIVLDHHHIIPKSRKNSSNQKWNIAIVDVIKHRFYHQLFKNRTPVEIICYLVEYFWSGQWNYVELALEKKKSVRAFERSSK